METVLLIEHDPARLVTLSLILHCFGYTVLEAGSLGEAWSVCKEHYGPIHVAILENDGAREVIARLQMVCPDTRSIGF